ncbi:MAG: DUF1634 domain-containing protein, partial [Thermoplasmata archaeon]
GRPRMNGQPSSVGAARSVSGTGTHRLALLLRTGLLAAAAVVLVGIVRVVLSGAALQLTVLSPGADQVAFNPSALWAGLAAGSGESILTLGLLLLVAVPVARVALGAVTFYIERDPLLTRATLVVLVLLLIGLFAIGPLLR